MSDIRGHGGPFPTQDGVDRSEAFVIIAGLTFKDDRTRYSDELGQEAGRLNSQMRALLEQAVDEAVREVLPQTSGLRQRAVRYRIGPDADGLFTADIVTVWDSAKDAASILAGIADAWAVAEITRRAWAKIKVRVSSAGPKHTAPSLTLSPYVLQKLCEDHVRRTYHPRAKLTGKWFSITTEFYGGYRSPAHPTSEMEYFITVNAVRKVYCYVVDGSGQVGSHYLREGRRERSLPLPDLLGLGLT